MPVTSFDTFCRFYTTQGVSYLAIPISWGSCAVARPGYDPGMPRRSREYRTPRDWLADGEWPEGPFVADAPTAVAYAVEISRRLEAGMKGESKAGLARRAE